MNISVIADHSTVTGFRLAGVNKGFEAEDGKDALPILKELFKDKEAGLIIITEKLYEELDEEIKRLTEKRVTPMIVAIPDSKGFFDERIDPIRALVKKAVGIEIKY
ncbi:MAG TPA: V-type ATP synthase subunit F [Euryarchaeota archaeon]|nr:V-type ATP synthase subunit F [archaeon BMS3Abin16]GBE56078.1 V-type ATP synthase subunit F [archaeon BMS3Bbin16]HDH28603.1 V-type ATP synthase subunit F [Euryarchaeota archaeon]HDY73605.1 V-type ATP synthase subunit F [Euryarchaeota archaeon]